MKKEIYILGPIDNESVAIVSQEISKAINEGAEKILFKVNSPGGSVIDAMGLYDEISALNVETECLIFGIAASAATYIPLACNHTKMYKSGTFMIHRCTGAVRGSIAEMENDLDYLEELENKVVAIYAAKTGKSPEEILTMMDATTYMNSEQALANGFIDEVVGSESKLFNVSDLELINSIETEEQPKNIVQKCFDFFKSPEAKEEETLKNKLSATEAEVVKLTNELESLKVSNESAIAELSNIINEYKLKEEALKNEIAAAQASLNETIAKEVNNKLAALGYEEEDLVSPVNKIEKQDYSDCKSIEDFWRMM